TVLTADVVEIVLPEDLDWLCRRGFRIKREEGVGLTCNHGVAFCRCVWGCSAVFERVTAGRRGRAIRVSARFLSSRARHIVNLFERRPHPSRKGAGLLSNVKTDKPHRYRRAVALSGYWINQHGVDNVVTAGDCRIAHLSWGHLTPRRLNLQCAVEW